MIEKIYLDNLSDRNVVMVIETIAEDGYILRVHRVGYDNSISGRQQVTEEVSEPYRSAIMLMWGDTPTVDESIAD